MEVDEFPLLPRKRKKKQKRSEDALNFLAHFTIFPRAGSG